MAHFFPEIWDNGVILSIFREYIDGNDEEEQLGTTGKTSREAPKSTFRLEWLQDAEN